MARISRVEVFAHDEIAIVHVMARTVRRCFLLGNDKYSGKSFDHRKGWVEAELERLALGFGIDLLSYAVMSNHFHLVLRSRPDLVETWDASEVARRWLTICPIRKGSQEPTESELNLIRSDPKKLQIIRERLSDISWWMRLLCQRIAQRANREDNETGKFWQARFRAVRLLDDESILACAAYVDLNPIRAAIAQSLEESQCTSIQRRIQAFQEQTLESKDRDSRPQEADANPAAGDSTNKTSSAPRKSPDSFLCAMMLDDHQIGAEQASNKTHLRASNKGFLNISTKQYIELLDWTARQIAPNKQGDSPGDLPPVMQRLTLSPNTWCSLVSRFGRLFSVVAGRPELVDNTPSRIHKKRYYMKADARTLYTSHFESVA